MSKPSRIVLTAVGPDQPGLVKEISTLLRGAGGNLEDSRMAILGGEFAVILLISAPSDAVERIRQVGQVIEKRLKLHCVLKETTASPQAFDHLLYHLRVTGLDRPGIVQTVTELLASRRINLATFESRLSYAPLSGTPMFVMEATLQVPPGVDVASLRRDLAAQCVEENLDFTLDSKA